MQTFFWPSVVAIYCGVILLLIDLYVEEFGARRWIKLLIFLVMVGFGYAFTKYVVIRKTDPTVAYTMDRGRLVVVIDNGSSDDLQDIDLKIRPDFPSDFVIDPKEVTHVPSVTFVDPMPFVSATHDEKIEAHYTVKQDGSIDPGLFPMSAYDTNFLRIRCDKLPAYSGITLTMALQKQKKRDDPPVGVDDLPVDAVGHVEVDGTYRGRFRVFAYKEEAKGTSYPPMPQQ